MIQTASQWDSLWIDCHLATINTTSGYGIIKHAAIATKDKKICWLGKKAELGAQLTQLAKKIYPLQGKWITPGLIDCHTHLIYAGNRANEFEQRLQGVSYAEIAKRGGGILATVAATRAASEEELYMSAAKRIENLLEQGVTTLEIKSGYGLDLATETKMLAVARKLGANYPITVRTSFLGAHAIPLEYQNRAAEYINYLCQTVLPQLVAAKLVDAIDAYCEKIAFSADQLKPLLQMAQKLGVPIKLHADQLSNCGGVQLATQFNALSVDHLEYSASTDIAAMTKTGTVAVLLPGAFYFLQETKKPPINLLRQYQIPIAIASDCNPGTSPINSLLTSMNLACVQFNITPVEALLGVTLNAARALGMATSHGSLEVGKIADFAIWDIEHPRDLAYYLGVNPCTGVVKSGVRC